MPLERILEPEVMDTEEDAVEYDSMDFAEVNRAFALRAIELAPLSGKVLDIGTGTARIPILILQNCSNNIQVHAVDLSLEMLRVAQQNVFAAGLEKRLTLQQVDAKRLPFESGSFDMIISNSLIHHIPEPQTFFDEVARIAEDQAAIFIRDLIRPDNRNDAERLVQLYNGDADVYQQKLFRDSLLAALTIEEIESYLRKAGIRHTVVSQSSDRHWSAERPQQRK